MIVVPEYLSPGVYIEEVEIGAKPIEGVSTSTAGFVGFAERGPLNRPTLVTGFAGYQSIFGGYLPGSTGDARWLAYAVEAFFNNGGRRAYVTRVAELDTTKPDYARPATGVDAIVMGTDNAEPSKRTGIHTLKNIKKISLVAVPGITTQAVQNLLITHCEEMKNRFAVLDPNSGMDLTGIQDQRNLYDSEYAALYYPWVQVYDPLSRGPVNAPPSGMICGIYARVDNERGVHKAPANETINGALGMEKIPDGSLRIITKGQQDILNLRGINCIRSFPGRGIRVWGARTLSSNALWKYINVRRLFNYIEESIEEGTQWVVFEPNNEKLWARVRATITQFLTRVWKDGALMGTKPEEAFFVKCDRTTMTQDDIDNGRLICMIGIAPVQPAEFVIFRIAQWQGGSAVTE
jgi:hypothetical protein